MKIEIRLCTLIALALAGVVVFLGLELKKAKEERSPDRLACQAGFRHNAMETAALGKFKNFSQVAQKGLVLTLQAELVTGAGAPQVRAVYAVSESRSGTGAPRFQALLLDDCGRVQSESPLFDDEGPARRWRGPVL